MSEKQKKMFSCVLHMANTLTYFEFPLKKKQIFEVLKNMFSHGFLKHNKKIYYFLALLDFTTCL
jgi:hypothetical protein